MFKLRIRKDQCQGSSNMPQYRSSMDGSLFLDVMVLGSCHILMVSCLVRNAPVEARQKTMGQEN